MMWHTTWRATQPSSFLQLSLAVADPSKSLTHQSPGACKMVCYLPADRTWEAGCWLGSTWMQTFGWDEILHLVLWPGQGALVHAPLPREEENYLPWTETISGSARAPCLYPSWHNALFIWKHFARWQLGSWTWKFLILHHHASCKETCGDICLLILVKRHLPRWFIPGNIRTHQSSSNQLVFFPLGNTPICRADQKLSHLGHAIDGKETHAWSRAIGALVSC